MNKQRINIIIPVKKSLRCPNKNPNLALYTYDWMYEETTGMDVGYYVVGDPNILPILPVNACLIHTDCKSLKDDMYKCINDDGIYVELLLTQPVRRPGLLRDAIEKFILDDRKHPVISAAYMQDPSWRELNDDGVWQCDHPAEDCRKLYYDGAIYVFDKNTFPMIFDRRAKKNIVINCGYIVDVDYKTDMPLKLTERVKSCIVIGSGSDINGRKMANDIDSGKYGKVFRVNRLYGDTLDIGKRTDVAVTLSTTVWNESVEQIDPELKKVPICNPYVHDNILNISRLMTGLPYPTTGIQAVCWVLRNGYRPTVIGYGFKNAERFTKIKTYADGRVDDSHHHNFDRENEILKLWHDQKKIKLL